jgi:hypothetical protein
MIRYDLKCDAGHAFDMWFADSATYDTLAAAGHVACPECGSARVEKALMAPGVSTRGRSQPMSNMPAPREIARKIAAYREKVMAETTDVGRDFPEQARDMHEGTRDHAPIRGQATPDEARALHEEGVPILPVPPEPPKEN